MFEFLPFLALSVALGFKHSFDADHVIAVSNVLRKSSSLKSSARIGASWAAGHMITAGIVTLVLFFFRESFLALFLPYFEKIFGVMLVFLGVYSLLDMFVFHSHAHGHGEENHSHFHMHMKKNAQEDSHVHRHVFGIGIVHGLASNDELLLLFSVSLGVASLGLLLLGLVFFSIGVVLGMLFFSVVFSFPLIKAKSQLFYAFVSLAVGFSSVLFGLQMIEVF